MKNYKIGWSLTGILAVALIMLPNIMYLFLAPPIDVLSGNEASYWLWNTLEMIGRFGLMITLSIVVNQNAPTKSRFTAIFAAGSLMAYYVLWILYFAGIFNGLSLVGLAFFPSVFFLLTAGRLRNKFAMFFAVIFAIMHIAITCKNFLQI